MGLMAGRLFMMRKKSEASMTESGGHYWEQQF